MNITLHCCRAPTKNLLLNPLELQVHNTHRSCTQLSTLVSILNGASILTKLYNCSEPNHILSKQNWNANVVTCLISAWRRCDNNTKIQYHLLMPHQTSVAYRFLKTYHFPARWMTLTVINNDMMSSHPALPTSPSVNHQRARGSACAN